MLPVNRQSILEKHYMQTFYERSWDIVKRFDNVLKNIAKQMLLYTFYPINKKCYENVMCLLPPPPPITFLFEILREVEWVALMRFLFGVCHS